MGDGADAVFISKEKISDKDVKILDINTTGPGHLGKAMDAIHLRSGNGGLKMRRQGYFHECDQIHGDRVKTILKKNHYTIKDIAHLIPHQAKLRIIAEFGEALGLHNGE